MLVDFARGPSQTPIIQGLEFFNHLEGNPNRYEKILESYTWSTGGLSALMAGASRMARLSIPSRSAEEAAIRDVAAGVVAPVLTAYVLWILELFPNKFIVRRKALFGQK
jgi:hypothetical protein